MPRGQTGCLLGVFDLFHVGHLRLLRRAAGLVDRLVVIVVADEAIREFKGVGRPIIPLAERMEIVAAVRGVSATFVSASFDPFDTVVDYERQAADRIDVFVWQTAARRSHAVARKTSIAHRIMQEAGKPSVEALTTEVLVVLDAARFLIDNGYSLLRAERLAHGNRAMKTKSGRIWHEPYGVIGIISPWNYPFSIPATETMAALLAGNAVVLKPSELTPLIALELRKLLHEAGVPEEIFQVLPGEGATGAALVPSEIDKLVFTGSVATGRRIAQIAAERLLPVVLELGGKDPMLVLDDADVDVASSGAVWGAFVNAGQTCLSVERCYVHRSLYPAFLDACAEKARKLRVGNGIDAATEIGPMIHERQVRIVEVARRRRAGTRRSRAGWRSASAGFRSDILRAHGACRRHSRHARDAGGNIWPRASHCAFRRRCGGRGVGQRL